MIRARSLICIFFIVAGQCYGQSESKEFRAWRLMSYSGSVGVTGFYRQQVRTLRSITDYSKFPFIMGKFSLYTRSYIVHPNLFLLDVGGEFNPGSSKQNYTVSPDRSEALTYSRLNLRGTLFSGKPMNLTGKYYWGRNYINREYVASLKVNSRQWGLKYNYYNKILPVELNYNDRKIDQLEIETGRTFHDRQKDFMASVKRSFTKNGDNNEVRFTRYSYFRVNQAGFQTDNSYDKWDIYNTYFIDPDKKYMFQSYINNLNQRGTVTQKRFQAYETVNLRLPSNFRFYGNYTYTRTRQPTQKFRQNRINVALENQLFKSLKSGVFYEYYKTVHTAYDESRRRVGYNFNYLKKIPGKGTLNLFYSYIRNKQKVVANPDSIIIVTDEQHVLADDQIVLLDRPYVNLSTVIVKDAIGSIVYQENLDYFLIERNEYVEIKRIPGGQIPNDGIVLVDYQAAQIGSYNYNSNLNTAGIRLTFIDRLIELYYTFSNQNYVNVETTSLITLNFFTRNVYGMRIQYKFFDAGVERDIYQSSIVPYKKMRYFLQMNGAVGKKLRLSMNGSVTDLTLTDTNTDQLYADVYGKAIYQLKPAMRINLDVGYRKQVGDEIDLDLFRSKLEFNSVYRKVYFKAGIEAYRRYYISEKLDYWGVYFQVDRKF